MSHKLELANWIFKSTESAEWLTAKVPGCVHTDLLRHKKIPDPFYGTNEHQLQWIDKQNWEYKSSFEVPAELLAEQKQQLIFNGLDTYADVYLNGEQILSANNMFRCWKVDVTGKLAASNELHIIFRSPIHEDLPKLRALGYALPSANDQSQLGGLGEERVSVFARKAPYHYGWDWGPRFVTSGIWRSIELVCWSCVKVEDIYIEQLNVNAEEANLNAIVSLQSNTEGKAKLTITTENLCFAADVELKLGEQELVVPMTIKNPKLWWCRGLGEPHRYHFEVEVSLEEQGRQHITRASVVTGLRNVKLVRKRDEHGSGASFYFELNGVAVFAKGANHIPNDSFITEVTAERYRAEVLAAAEANMNMLRVWGGGVYEADVFYDLCDEYGIMVWQDFMFACSMYPGDEAFLESVKHEAIDNVKRLRNHPSIVLWCGNNEIDSAWAHYDEDAGWGWKKDYTAEQREKLWQDYENIFHKLLPSVVGELHASVDYWPSSPLVSLTGDKHQHAHPLTNEGDIHYWGVWHNVEPFENYQLKIGRFMSEYGFQSFPEYRTIRSFAEENELDIESEVMLAHQKNGNGNRLIKEYMDIYMKQPVNFHSFLYLSQLLQADAMKMAIEAHRRSMPYCMGSLYWQMNDCWPVASWSGIDYFGRWKALHYYARRSFAPVLLSPEEKEGQLKLYLVSDASLPQKGKLTLQLYHLSGHVLYLASKEITTSSQPSQLIERLVIAELLANYKKQEVVLAAFWEGENGVIASCLHYFVNNAELELLKPNLTVHEQQQAGQTIVTIESDVVAKGVVLIAEEEGIWSDNYFDLIPGKPHTVSFMKFAGGSSYTPALSGKLQVKSMLDYVK